MDHMMHDMGGGDSCKVSMLWNWYTIDACFLAEGWHIKTRGHFAGTCIGVICLVIIVEALRRLGREYDEFITRQAHRHFAQQHGDDKAQDQPAAKLRVSLLQQLIRSVIHAATFGLGYIIMLLAMYFNGYIIICIFIGAGLGKFICDWLVINIDLKRGRGTIKGIEEATVCCG